MHTSAAYFDPIGIVDLWKENPLGQFSQFQVARRSNNVTSASSWLHFYSCMHFEHSKEEEEEEEDEEEEEEKYFGRLATFWFGTFAIFFRTTGCVHHENA